MALIHHIDHPVVEGVRIGRRSPGGGYKINSTCIVYRLGDTIIDTGPSAEWKLVQRFLQERSVRQALVTHYHEDHSGNCGHIEQCFNSVIHSHKHNHDKLSQGWDMRLISKVLFGNISFAQAQDFPEQIRLDSGQELKALHMPGHSDDMTCFLEPNQGWLFSGDLYVASKVKYAHKEESIGQQIDSLKAALALDFEQLFCAHRGFIADGRQALQNKLDFLVELQQQVQFLYQQGKSLKQIRLQLLGREDVVAYGSCFDMSKANLIAACLK